MPDSTLSNALWNFNQRHPSYLFHWGGYQVFDSAKGKFIDAPAADQQILRDYPAWIDKGPLTDSTRITITTSKTAYKTGETISIGHIIEETGKTRTLYVMGPKTITDEFVNDILKSPVSTDAQSDYPWLGMSYDGLIENAPGMDYNFEITRYRFTQPGTYKIQWKPGKYRSNVLVITVTL